MVNNSGGSFIPKSPVGGNTPKPRNRRRVYLFTYIVSIFFFSTLIAAGAVFFFNASILGDMALQQELIAQEKKAFNQSQLEAVSELEERLNLAKKILENHVSLVRVFGALEESVLTSATLSSFLYTQEENNLLTFTIDASLPDFNAALFQREVLSGNKVLAGSAISSVVYTGDTEVSENGVTVGEPESVSFAINKNLVPSEIPYAPLVNNQNVQDDTQESEFSAVTEDVVGDSEIPASDTGEPVLQDSNE